MDDFEVATSLEQQRRDKVVSEISERGGNGEAAYSPYERALDEITKSAVNHALATSRQSGKPADSHFQYFLHASCSVVSNLWWAIGGSVDDLNLSLWRHVDFPVTAVKSKSEPQIGRQEIEAVTEEYLRLPFRCRHIDRILVDALLATEVIAYASEMINAPSIPIVSSSAIRKRPILEWGANNVLNGIFWLIFSASLFGLSRIHIFPTTWLPFAYGISFFMAGLTLVLSTVFLPQTWLRARAAKREILRLLDLMTGVYSEMKSSGPISARHIEQRARSAADGGVIWPAPLFVLLDDVDRRDATI